MTIQRTKETTEFVASLATTAGAMKTKQRRERVLGNKSEADEWTSRQAGTVKHVPFCGIQRQRDVLSDERKSVYSVDSV